MGFGHVLREKNIHRIFELGVILKGLDGVLQVSSGTLLLFISPGELSQLFYFIVQPELAEDPRDKLVNYLSHLLGQMSAYSKYFLAVYLIVHGLTKLGIVAGLLRNRLWAYPAGIVLFSIFAIYQTYRIYFSFSWSLFALTVLDIVVIFLTWHEYRVVLHKKNAP